MIPAADGGGVVIADEPSLGNSVAGATGVSADEPVENPGDLLTAALNGEISDEELEAVDQALDSMMLGEAAVSKLAKGKPLLTVEEAQAKLSPGILEVLATKFKGSLTQVRHIDEQDKIF
ncbi:hypothetical protein QEH59_02845 [Coraliomargarita sp. SDUM461004]|uniref:Uncharacterized protein n=1 Tax=Thalassobacterium sedimentorum TaxID=3041258 RepID=A0ABU1AHJ4_9BACT|nr:hypothetical protein [Coraliomargarita sp. SDUM461004]MDQ8193345.1 hypothetical protein [Coraliomargarita sp. SDUM461004]